MNGALDRGEETKARLLRYLGVLAVGWAARGLYLAIRPEAAVSVDVKSWHTVAQLLLQGENPYEQTTFLNWPPVWPACLWLIAQAAIALHVAFETVLWASLIAVESFAIVALLRLVESFGRRATLLVLVSVSLNPALIFQVTQHGNFDVLMMTWVLLALGRFVRHRDSGRDADWYWGCFWLGLGVLTKTVPLAFLPIAAMAGRPMGAMKAFRGLVYALAPGLVGVWIIYASAPEAVWVKVIRYRSFGGWYGITGLMSLAGAALDHQRTYASLFTFALLAWIGIGSVILGWGRRADPRLLLLLGGLVMLAIPTLGPGYGPQYVWWYWPILLASYALYPVRWWRALLAIAGGVTAASYVFEYLTFPTHGGWLLPSVGAACARPGVQTLVRLPLFVVSLATLSGAAVLLVEQRSPASRQVEAASAVGLPRLEAVEAEV